MFIQQWRDFTAKQEFKLKKNKMKIIELLSK